MKQIFVIILMLCSVWLVVSVLNQHSIVNEVELANDIDSKNNLANIACLPANVSCPSHIPFNAKAKFLNIAELTIVYIDMIYIIKFPDKGVFHFKLSALFNSKKPLAEKGECVVESSSSKRVTMSCQ